MGNSHNRGGVGARPLDIGAQSDRRTQGRKVRLVSEGVLTTTFDGRTVTYVFGELDMLVPAYAATIHKSQGSEYPAVVIPMLTQHYAMLRRNLLYTGVPRGKKLVVVIGQKKAVAIAVRNVSGIRRWSNWQSGWILDHPVSGSSIVEKIMATSVHRLWPGSARERQAEGAGRAEAIAESATDALDLIRKARDARRAAAAAAADPGRLRDDHGFRRD